MGQNHSRRKHRNRPSPSNQPTGSRKAAAEARSESAWHLGVAQRLREAVAGDTLIEVSRCKGINRETVRRHLRDGRPSLEFVVQICRLYGANADWLLGVYTRATPPTALKSTPIPRDRGSLKRRDARNAGGSRATRQRRARR